MPASESIVGAKIRKQVNTIFLFLFEFNFSNCNSLSASSFELQATANAGFCLYTSSCIIPSLKF
jgi:hypothetical protein